MLNIRDQIADVGAAVQNFVHARHQLPLVFVAGTAVQRGIPQAEHAFEFAVHFRQLGFEIALRRFEPAAQAGEAAAIVAACSAQFIERFVQLEDLFQQLRGGLLPGGAFLAHAALAQQIFHAAHRLAQRAVGVVQLRGAVQRHFALARLGEHKTVGMQLPAQLMEALLERRGVNPQLGRQPQQRKVVGAGRDRLNLAAAFAELSVVGAGVATPAGERQSGGGVGFRH